MASAHEQPDVIVVGAGNAALCAALTAHEAGARVLILEKASHAERGGNSRYSGALLRFAYQGFADVQRLLPDLDPDLVDTGSYPAEAYARDMMRTTQGEADPEMTRVVTENSYATVQWLTEQGVTLELRQSPWAKVGGKLKVTPGAVIEAKGKGIGLTSALFAAVEARGIEIRYEMQVVRLLVESGRVTGVIVATPSGEQTLRARAVVLASGGFEANPELRVQHLGPEWDRAKVRGTRHNTGETLLAAVDAGAQLVGDIGGAHATPIDATAPDYGDLRLTDRTNRLSYPYGIMVNTQGERFVDEGEDLAVYTYAKTGPLLLTQPDDRAYQIFDQQTLALLEPRYSTGTPITADTIEELAALLEVPVDTLVQTVEVYNHAADQDRPFNSAAPDGRRADLTPVKSNWSLPLTQPPFVAYPVACGITFTYGGIAIDTDARVTDREDAPIPGLYATGEITGGLFYHNYPAGAGLVFGAVFGRIAGRNAAHFALAERTAAATGSA